MRRLVAFLRLSAAERALLLRTGLFVAAVRVALWVAPFDRTQAALAAWVRLGPERPVATSADEAATRVLWAVRLSSRHVPYASCLTQALVAHALLDRQNLPNVLRIGVARNTAGTLEAHAWIERDGTVVLGDLEDLGRFTPLPPFPGNDRG